MPRMITYQQALVEGMRQEMARDRNVIVYGIGVPDHKRIFGTTVGLLEEFGSERCFDTPLSEDALAGFGIGAAAAGLRPIYVHIRVDFVLLALNQLINMASSLCYGSAGQLSVPLVVRAVIGRGWGQGFQHSKSLQGLFAQIPGLKVVMPTTAQDAKGLMIAAIRDNNPVIMLEHRWLYWQQGDVSEEPFEIPLGQGHILREGSDITIVATSWMNVEALKAQEIMAKRGISVELVDPRTIAPLDEALLVKSVLKTRHCIVADYDWQNCGFSAEVAAMLSEKCFGQLHSPVTRVGFAPTPCPTARHLENEFYPNATTLVRAIEQKLGLSPTDLSGEDFYNYERVFKGPF